MITTPPLAAFRGLLTLALLLGLGATDARAKATLRWKFQPGEVLRYQTNQTTTSKVKDGDGKEILQTLTLTIDLSWAVKAVDPSGSASLTQTIDRIRTTATMPFGKFSHDSKEAGDASSPAGPIFKMLVGSEIGFKMSPRGELSEIKLSEKLLATLKGGDEPAGAQGQFSEAGLKNMLELMGIVLPEEAVDPGATWARKLAIPAGPDGQTRAADQTFTYAGPDPSGGGKAEAIELATRFEPIKADPNVPVTIKSEEARGKYLFDNAGGRIESSTLTQHVELTGQIGGKDLAQSTDTSTVMTLAKGKPAP